MAGMYEKHAAVIHRDGLTSSELAIVQALDSLPDSSSTQYLILSGGLIANQTAAWGVVSGGTGNTSLTPYALLTGGITATGILQQVSGLGAAGQVLTSNGSGALPSWQDATGGGGGSVNVEVPTGVVDGVNITFTVSNTPKFVVIDGLVRRSTMGYTYLAGTITVDSLIPPTYDIFSVY